MPHNGNVGKLQFLNKTLLREEGQNVSNTNLSCEDFLFRHIGRNMFQIKVDVEGNEITDQAATAAVSAKKEKINNCSHQCSGSGSGGSINWIRIHNSVIRGSGSGSGPDQDRILTIYKIF